MKINKGLADAILRDWTFAAKWDEQRRNSLAREIYHMELERIIGARVTYTAAHIRSIGLTACGEVGTVVGAEGRWLKVDFDGDVRLVCAEYLERA